MISVVRTPDPPASLAARRSYASADVHEQLRTDFLGKCYLCERKLSGSLQVEHLKPKTGAFAHLEFEWSNLYPSDSCNQCRKTWSPSDRIDPDTAYPKGGLLDPASGAYDVMERLIQRMVALPPVSASELRFEFAPRDASDVEAANSAAELHAIHTSPKPSGITLRSEIHEYWCRVLHHVWRATTTEGAERAEAAAILRVLVRVDQPYYAVVRGTLEELAPGILHELDL